MFETINPFIATYIIDNILDDSLKFFQTIYSHMFVFRNIAERDLHDCITLPTTDIAFDLGLHLRKNISDFSESKNQKNASQDPNEKLAFFHFTFLAVLA
jgi:hypothetical protein